MIADQELIEKHKELTEILAKAELKARQYPDKTPDQALVVEKIVEARMWLGRFSFPAQKEND